MQASRQTGTGRAMHVHNANSYADRFTTLNIGSGPRVSAYLILGRCATLAVFISLGVLAGRHVGLPAWALVVGVLLAVAAVFAVALRSLSPYLLPGPRIQIGRHSWLAFHMFSGLGLAIGVAINLGLGAHFNLPLWMSVIVALVGILMIPLEAIVIKIVTGR